jgi:hypothetical protein
MSSRFARCLTLLGLTVVAAPALAQTVIPRTPPDLGDATLALPPGPSVTDWQPRSRAAVGMKIVITGPSFRPADVVAVVGSAKIVLPVRLQSSTSTRIELDVPAGALGQLGSLAIGHKGTRGTVLETSYRIDVLRPELVDTRPYTPKAPFANVFHAFDVKEFPGATTNNEQITFGGTCAFRKAPVLTGTRTRNADFRITLILVGWFEQAGSCQLQLGVTPIAANGSSMSPVLLTLPVSVPTPQQYVFDNTGQLTTMLAPALTHAGVGSTCEANQGAPGATGVTTIGSDLQILVRGGVLDQSCAFRTSLITLGDGVRLTEIRWKTNTVGQRCGEAGSFSPTLPSSSFAFTRGSVVVNPDTRQPVRDFFAFGHGAIVAGGVTLTTSSRPTTVMLPMVVDLQCVSMAVPLQTSTGILPPTTSPQSFGVILDRLVLEGPPGLSLNDLMRRGG